MSLSGRSPGVTRVRSTELWFLQSKPVGYWRLTDPAGSSQLSSLGLECTSELTDARVKGTIELDVPCSPGVTFSDSTCARFRLGKGLRVQ